MTRLVALGVVEGLLFKKRDVHDNRELYSLIESGAWGAVTKCNPDQGAQARAFA